MVTSAAGVDVQTGVRNRLLVPAAVSFLMMATGVTLHLHLAHFEEPAHHHSEQCPVCQVLLAAPKKVTLELDPPALDDCRFAFVADTRPAECVQSYYPHQILPRGPPSVC